MSPKVLKERVEKAGFFVGSMIITLSVDNVDLSNNNNFEKDGLAFVVVDAKTKMLNGETKVKIMDKGFVTQKEFKKLSKSLNKYPTYMMENEDDFHIKIN